MGLCTLIYYRQCTILPMLEKFGSKDSLIHIVMMYLFMVAGIQAIANASIEELAEVTNRSHAQQLYNFF